MTEFKVQVVREILREEKSLSQIASEYGTHIMILGFRTKDDRLVRCKQRHGKEDPQAVQC